MRFPLWALMLIGLAFSLFGGDAVQVNPYGDLRLGGEKNLFWFHAGPNWSTNKRMNRTTLVPKPNQPAGTIAGAFAVNGTETFDFVSKLTKQQPNQWHYRATFNSKSGAAIGGLLFMSLNVPVEEVFAPLVNGTRVTMPAQYKDLLIFETKKEEVHNTVSFQTGAGQITLEGNFKVRLQDNRRFKFNSYNLRLTFPGCEGNVKSAEVELTIRFDTLKCTPVDLSSAVNMAFADEVADDGRGGWSDQGPSNDLGCMPLGNQNFGGVDFQIIDPAKNGNRSCLVQSGQQSRPFPPAGVVKLTNPAKHPYLYLLHGAAWVPKFKEEVGQVVVTYTDDSQSLHPVRNGVDVGNWWRPSMSLPNAFLGWQGNNAGGGVGLFVSHFRLMDKPVQEIRFVPVRGVWMVVAATFGNISLECPQDKPYIVEIGPEWSPVEYDGNVRKGSPLDFSAFCDAPAGKYGRIITNKEGHFVFEKRPDQRVRFWGTNLCQSVLFPTHEEADRMADNLAALGYNSVRLHQFERGLMDRSANDTLTFHPQQLDRYFYLIAALKKRGMYICTDIYATRPIRPGDGIEECAKADGLERKVLNFFSPTAMKNWKEYARRLMTTKNPYTGMTLAEDPALYMVCLDNEAPILAVWNQFPLVAHVPEAAFKKHLQAKNQPVPTERRQYLEQFYAYLAERQSAIQREQRDYLREIGCKFMITNLNNDAYPEYQPFRHELEMVDLHSYHDHPTFPQASWSTPTAYRQRSPIETELGSLTYCAVPRVFGRPFAITELDFCAPNVYRSAGGVLTGAYCALQGHDAVYRFSYTHSQKNLQRVNHLVGFDTIYDPVRTMCDRQSALLFLRGDVKEAETAAAFGWNKDFIKRSPKGYPKDYVRLSFYGKVGAMPAGSTGKVPVLDPEKWEESLPADFAAALQAQRQGVMKSATGEMAIFPTKNRVELVTPRSEAVVLDKGAFQGKVMQLDKVNTFASVSLHAMDDKALANSGEMLMFFLTDAANKGMRFANEKKQLLETWGGLPLVVRQGNAQVTLHFADNGPVKVEKLGVNGEILGTVKVTTTADGKVIFTADAAQALAYRITRNGK